VIGTVVLCSLLVVWFVRRWQSEREYDEDLRAARARARIWAASHPTDGPDLLDRRTMELVSQNAVNCGDIELHDDPTKANACVMRSIKRRKPFRVRYQSMGADSYVADALVGLPDGTVETLSYDSDAAGGGRRRGAETVSRWECLTPVQLTIKYGHVTCAPKPREHSDRFVPGESWGPPPVDYPAGSAK
jgi:hypothetical protein